MTSSLSSPPALETSQSAGRLRVFGPHLATWATADPTQIRTYRAVRATARRSASDGPESARLNAWSLAMGLTSDTAQPRRIGVLASRLVPRAGVGCSSA